MSSSSLPATVGLADGSAMVIGGINSDDVSCSSATISSATTRAWADGPLLDVAREQSLDATLLSGYSSFNTEGDPPWRPEPMTSVERFTPPPP